MTGQARARISPLWYLGADEHREADTEGEQDHADDHVVNAPAIVPGVAHVVHLRRDVGARCGLEREWRMVIRREQQT